MPDTWEIAYSLNPLVNDAENDADQDGPCPISRSTSTALTRATGARAKAAAAEPPAPAADGEAAPAGGHAVPPRQKTHQPWKKEANTRGFGKVSLPRKVGGG